MRHLASAIVLAAGLLAGCGKGEDPKPAAPDPAEQVPQKPVPAPEKCGRILVRVVLRGEPPKPKAIEVTDAECMGAHVRGELRDTKVVVGASGELANVIVWLDRGVDPGWRWPVPQDPFVLDQAHCMFTPRAGTMRAGQPLEIRNSDETIHFVHAKPRLNPGLNVSLVPGSRMTLTAEGKTRTFMSQEEPFPIICDPHPWMYAMLGVFRHPFHGVTGTDGTVTLQGVPEGEYTLKLKHEKYGVQESTVKVAAGGDAAVAASFGE
ncbi:MAG: hypothetical protein HUU15_06800 [Candidatus Brocadiae bacterium]|nr:hypothetical protein [Candidatus Brocadiia bacterium]